MCVTVLFTVFALIYLVSIYNLPQAEIKKINSD
ncbi:hypothetical protein C8N41_1011147 [Winogradskyella sediminis]|nr:hypothetical protein C8N41_1011147 [Winogradskyella sediminis]